MIGVYLIYIVCLISIGSMLYMCSVSWREFKVPRVKVYNRIIDEVMCSGPTVRRAVERAVHKGKPLCLANLKRADLRGADLRGAHLWGADLEGADLTRANVTGVSFEGVHMKGANLHKIKGFIMPGQIYSQ